MSNIDKLQNIKETIELMNKCHQVEILKILKKESITMSENNNGMFINLTNVKESIILELEKYINFVNTQQNQLLSIETEKANIRDEFFNLTK
jgi:hypothetical protein